jgi:hypothetical protein
MRETPGELEVTDSSAVGTAERSGLLGPVVGADDGVAATAPHPARQSAATVDTTEWRTDTPSTPI